MGRQELDPIDQAVIEDANVLDRDMSYMEFPLPAHKGHPGLNDLWHYSVRLYLQRSVEGFMPYDGRQRCQDLLNRGIAALQTLWSASINDGTMAMFVLPLFILGVAADHVVHRHEVVLAFDQLQRFHRSGGVGQARVIVGEVWTLMDSGKADGAWNWEALIVKKGWDLVLI